MILSFGNTNNILSRVIETKSFMQSSSANTYVVKWMHIISWHTLIAIFTAKSWIKTKMSPHANWTRYCNRRIAIRFQNTSLMWRDNASMIMTPSRWMRNTKHLWFPTLCQNTFTGTLLPVRRRWYWVLAISRL